MKLIKTGNSWRDWIITTEGQSVSLQNGTLYDQNIYELPHESNGGLSLHQLEKLTFESIPAEIRIPVTAKEIHPLTTFAIISNNNQKPCIEACWAIDPIEWKDPSNPVLLRAEMLRIHKSLCNNNVGMQVEDNDGYLDSFFIFRFDRNTTIGQATIEAGAYIENLQETANNKIQNLRSTNKILTQFEFSPELQNSCSRYLLYFVEFLRDLGIEANSEIKKKGHKTLFSIEPTDKETSLKTIKEALAIYLCLPEIDITQTTNHVKDPVTSLKIEKLSAEISNLKSEKKIQAALARVHEGNLKSLEERLKILESQTIRSDLKEITINNKEESKPEFFGGAIKLGKFQKFGIEFDWGAINKSLKKKS